MRLFILFCMSLFLAPAHLFAAESNLRIGYYGGTFDPVTLGHRDLVERAMKEAHLDLMYVMPSVTNSHKPNATPYPLRKQMLALGFADMPDVRIGDANMEKAFQEDRATGVLKVLMGRYPSAKFFRITGDDVISRNYTPYMESDPAFNNIGLVIGKRAGPNEAKSEDIRSFNFGKREVIVLDEAQDKGISSTEVRGLIQSGRPQSEVPLNPRVYEFIKAHHLFVVPRCGGVFGKAS